MAFVMRVRDAQGRITFDSTLATGGVALGFYALAAGTSVFSFPDMTGATGYAISAGRTGGYFSYATDNDQGFLRFTLFSTYAGQTVVLFAK